MILARGKSRSATAPDHPRPTAAACCIVCAGCAITRSATSPTSPSYTHSTADGARARRFVFRVSGSQELAALPPPSMRPVFHSFSRLHPERLLGSNYACCPHLAVFGIPNCQTAPNSTVHVDRNEQRLSSETRQESRLHPGLRAKSGGRERAKAFFGQCTGTQPRAQPAPTMPSLCLHCLSRVALVARGGD